MPNIFIHSAWFVWKKNNKLNWSMLDIENLGLVQLWTTITILSQNLCFNNSNQLFMIFFFYRCDLLYIETHHFKTLICLFTKNFEKYITSTVLQLRLLHFCFSVYLFFFISYFIFFLLRLCVCYIGRGVLVLLFYFFSTNYDKTSSYKIFKSLLHQVIECQLDLVQPTKSK